MKQVNIHEAKTHLSALLKLVEQGKEVIIARKGKPIAKLTEFKQKKKKRKLGRLKGKGWIADDFDILPDEIARAFGMID